MSFLSFNIQQTGTALFEIIKQQAALGRLILDYFHVFFDSTFHVFLFIASFISFLYIILSLWSYFSKVDNTEKKFIKSKAPMVSINIPTRNEVIALRCARKCLEFDYPKSRFEIIIGDDSNDKVVSDEIDEFAKENPGVVVARRKNNVGFKPGNLNNMLKYCKGDIIVVFDSDFAPEKDFLRRIVSPFIHDKDVAAVQAKWKFFNTNKNIVTVLASSVVFLFHNVFLRMMKKNETGFICGSAEAVRKSYLIKYGGWLSGCMTEDIEYSLRIHKNNKKIIYLPELKCYNEVPETWKDLSKQQMRWAYGVISAYKKHGLALMGSKVLSLRKKIYSSFGLFGYTVPVLVLILASTGILSIVTHRPEPLDLVKFFLFTFRNISLTLGLIIASVIALHKEGMTKQIFKMVVASFSVGLIVTYFVNIGIFKALTNKPMKWFLLTKSKDHASD